ncbi:MAG: glycoside hydrolase family 5 protein [archaeon GB-1867-005]|nr:glycoside hydrolase family 5 protein [Candidatus Culexmicrobium cathedralense]
MVKTLAFRGWPSRFGVFIVACLIMGLCICFLNQLCIFRFKREGLPKLEIVGNELLASGKEVILRGVGIADPAYLDWEGKFGEELFDVIKMWNVNVVRVPVHPVFWKRYFDYLERYLDRVVEWCEERGIYVIIDWHAIGNPITGETETPENFSWMYEEPWNGENIYDPNFTLAVNFWSRVAERFRGRSNVLYEIFNEPAWIEWEDWKPLAEEIIRLIRGKDADVIIIVGGVDWAYDLRGVLSDPISGENIAYAVHVYPGRPMKEWDYYWGRVAEHYPVFVTEWGYEEEVDYEFLKGSRSCFGEPLISYMEDRVAGWTAWVFHPVWDPSMLKNWEYDVTEFGSFVKELLNNFSAGGGT